MAQEKSNFAINNTKSKITVTSLHTSSNRGTSNPYLPTFPNFSEGQITCWRQLSHIKCVFVLGSTTHFPRTLGAWSCEVGEGLWSPKGFECNASKEFCDFCTLMILGMNTYSANSWNSGFTSPPAVTLVNPVPRYSIWPNDTDSLWIRFLKLVKYNQ